MQNARSVVITVAVTLVVIVLLAATFIFSGLYNVSAAAAHTGIMSSTLAAISDRSIDTHAKNLTPPKLDSAALLEGAEHFHAMCEVCHGAPGVAKNELAEGLNPKAPELSKETAGEFSESQLFWVIRNGIKFTGMPGFQGSHTDEQIWAIAEFVKKLDKMTPEQYESVMQAVKAANGGELPGMEGADHDHDHDHGDMKMGPDTTHHH